MQPLSEALADQYQQSQDGQPPEHREGDGLGTDGVLHMMVHGVGPSHGEGVAVADLRGQVGEGRLERRQPGASSVQSKSHPRVGDLPPVPDRGRWRQIGALLLIELVDERRWGVDDPCHPEGGRSDDFLGLRVVELVVDRAA